MKIRISKDGNLEIERAGEIKIQFCPFDHNGNYCGDWCPLFIEPQYSQGDVRIELCDETMWCVAAADFTDERKEG